MKKIILIAVVLQQLPLFAFATGQDRGGGQAVVCRDSNKNIKSAVMLDLFEAEKIYKLKLLSNDQSKTYEDLAYEVAGRIEIGGLGFDLTPISNIKLHHFGILPTFHMGRLKTAIYQVIRGMNLIPDAGLNPIDDSNPIVRPSHCEIEQVAIYYDTSLEVQVVKEIWDAFDNVSKAALLVHEGLYELLRNQGETNSDRVRLAVGHGFAGTQFKYVLEGIVKKVDTFSETVICGTSNETDPKYTFAVYKNELGFWTLQFLWMHGKFLLSKTTHNISDEISPLVPLSSGFFSSGLTSRISESIFDGNLFMSLRKWNASSGKTKFAVGLVTKNLSTPITYEVTCNRTKFRCLNNVCEYQSWAL